MQEMHSLKPIHDKKTPYDNAIVTKKSTLWGKDTLLKADGETHLYSNGTEVCYIDAENQVHLLPLWNYSATTLRHIKEFLKQKGFKANTKIQIEKDYCNY